MSTPLTALSKPENNSQISREELLARARDLAPRLRERAARCIAERNVPVETIADYHEAGFLKLAQPRRYGGLEISWEVLCEISQILAAADGSQAWIHRVLADHAQMVATFPAECQDEVWGSNSETLISSSFDPAGRATRVKGGFRFSGKHRFASGIDHAHWLICGGFIEERDRLDGPHFFLVPKAEVTVIDDWHTLGLEGSGSKSFEVNNVFLPEHRLLNGELARVGNGPGTAVNKAAVYRTPRGGVTSTGFAALSVGMAQSVLEEWLAYTGPRKSRGVPVAEQPGSLFAAAEASAGIAAAEALYFGTISRSMRRIEAGERLDDFDLLTARRNVSYSVKLAVEAGQRIASAAGASAMFDNQRISRQYRNLLMSSGHFAVSWDTHGPNYARKLLDMHKAPGGA